MSAQRELIYDRYHRRVYSDVSIRLATSRAQSMKSCATGLSARFFRVTTPFSTPAIGSPTGNALISERFAGNFKAEAEKIDRNRPVAMRLILTCGESVTTAVRG
jgi:hypothetical protein